MDQYGAPKVKDMFKDKPHVDITSYRENDMWSCERKSLKGRLGSSMYEMFCFMR